MSETVMNILPPQTILLSRTDSIGDVCLTLPLAGILKKEFPEAQIIFLGNSYTKPVIQCSSFVDEIWCWDDFLKMNVADRNAVTTEKSIDTIIHVFPRKEIARWAMRAKIPNRIGTSHRLFHLLTCNHRVNFTRKNSHLHESQLNTKLLVPLCLNMDFSLEALAGFAGFTNHPALPERIKELFLPRKKTIVLHPKSKGSATEWPIENFISLAKELDSEKFTMLFTGTEQEGALYRHFIPQKSNIHDLTGKLTLTELIAVISKSSSLVAASTGPLHIAGLCGINTIGLYSGKRPIHSGRWSPLGIRTVIFEDKKNEGPLQPLRFDFRDIIRRLDSL